MVNQSERAETNKPEPNPFAPPVEVSSADAIADGDAITLDELTSYVRRNTAFYWRHLKRSDGRARWFVGWNWGAAVFSLMWVLYRRMYKEFGVLALILVVWGFVEGLAEELLLGGALDPAVERLETIVTAVIYGLIGNGMYLKHVERAVARARNNHPNDPPTQLAELRRTGGTSKLAAALGIIGMLVLIALLMYLAETGFIH